MIENLECRRFRNRIDAFIDGELSPSESEEMRRHAESCPDCGKLLKEYQDMLKMLRTLDEGLEIPPEAAQAWRSAVRDESERARPRKGRGWIRATVSLAAAVAVLLGVTTMYRNGLLPTKNAPVSNARPGYTNAEYADTYDAGYMAETDSAAGALTLGSMADSSAVSAAAKTLLLSDGAGDGETAAARSAQESARQPVIVREASRDIETTRFDESLQAIDALTADMGGWLEYRSVAGQPFAEGGSGRYAKLRSRVPTDRLDEFLETLAGVGATVSSSNSSRDVSGEYYDAEARLNALRAQYERLTDLVADAADLSDLIELEDKLYEVQYEIDSLEGQLRDLSSQASFSTVAIDLDEVRELTELPAENPTVGERIEKGFAESLEWLREFLQDMLVAVVTFSPALVVIVPAVILLWLIARRIRRRKRR